MCINHGGQPRDISEVSEVDVTIIQHFHHLGPFTHPLSSSPSVDHDLSFLFHRFLKRLRHTIAKCARGSYFIVLGKNKQVKRCLPMSAKLCALNHLIM